MMHSRIIYAPPKKKILSPELCRHNYASGIPADDIVIII